MYDTFSGACLSQDWGGGSTDREPWDGMERVSGSCKIGMLLDLDEGTLSVYKNERKLGVMKRGLAGHYCWVVSSRKLLNEMEVSNITILSIVACTKLELDLMGIAGQVIGSLTNMNN